MTGFTTDYVNQIAINLRDRYRSGFPILKELVQNADDAGAKSLAFGFHAGHGVSADHMLLKGPALWVLNDGRFKASDRQAIRSFGLNAKAGDSGAIGKFGLGMKSVFHLCESFFYVASNGVELSHDFLNPWRADDYDCSEMHQQWEQVTQKDLGCLEALARDQPETSGDLSWFLLWVPLRQQSHIPRSGDRPMAAIIERYPGDNPAEDLDFFSDPSTDQRIGGLLPLLRNLKQVRFAGADMRSPYTVTLESHPSDQRLDHETDDIQINGTVKDDRPKSEQMHFLVRQRVLRAEKPFGEIRAAKTWPTSMVITEVGTREPKPDKAVAEAAVMFAHADKRAGRLVLQWAVFLPAEDQGFSYEVWIPESSREYRIVLHGQFFVDAGRRGIADMDALDKPYEALPDSPSQHLLLRQWNQALAQNAVLPEFLPGLSKYVKSVGLKDEDIAALTRAIMECSAAGDSGSRSAFYPTFKQYICKQFAWIRRLSKSGPRWELVEPNIEPILPLPAPPQHDADRPWRALPGLVSLSGYAFSDIAAPSLADGHATWDSSLLISALKGIDTQILKSGTDLDYLANFLEMESTRYVSTGEVQDVLICLLRTCLQSVPLVDVRQHRKIFKRIVQLLSPDRIFVIGPQDHTAKGAIPEALYRTLLSAPSKALPVPGDLGPDGISAMVTETDLAAWLEAVMRHDLSQSYSGSVSKTQLLDTSERIIRAAGDDIKQLSLLRQCSHLKVLRALKGDDGELECVSLAELTESHNCGWLFKLSDPNRPLGFVQKLARALPDIQTLVVGRSVAFYVDSVRLDGKSKIPSAEDTEAILKATGVQGIAPRLGENSLRADLLTLVSNAKLEDPYVIRGIRYLLHGSADHFLGCEVLWKDPVGQKSPWVRLWRMVDETPWRVLIDSLCSSIPDKCAQQLNIKAVDEPSVINRLRVCNDFSRVDANEFSSEEIDMLLGRIVEEHAWIHLPLHRDVSGHRAAVLAECFLGRVPELPKGLDVGLRFIEPSANEDHLRQQKKFIKTWNDQTAAFIVLKADRPVQYWRYLMDLLSADPTIAQRLPKEWNEAAWLPLENGQTIALSSLIYVRKIDAEIKELARQSEYAYASPEDLASELRSHPAFSTLLEQVSSGEAAIPVLGQMMSAAGLSIGRALSSGYRDLHKNISTFVSIDHLPAWGIIEKVTVATSIDAVEKHLVPEISKQLTSDISLKVLNQISNLGMSDSISEVFGVYLKEWRASASEPELRKGLSKLRLLSRARTWVQASELVAGVHGVIPELVVNERQLESLRGIVYDNLVSSNLELSEVKVDDVDAESEQLLDSLEKYFEPLVSSSVKPAVGAVLGLFGEQVASLAKSWLDPIAYEDYLAKLDWRDPGHTDGPDRRVNWMGNKTLTQALGTLTIHLSVLSGNQIMAKSLTGALVKVEMTPLDEAQTLFVMTDRWQGLTCHVHMRPVSAILDKEPQQQRDILMLTGEALLKNLYNQQHANLSELFTLANEADQVTLDVARGLILDGLQQSLRSLPGIGKNQKLAQALASLDEARRGFASAKHAGLSIDSAAKNVEKALTGLAALVESDEEVQAAVLGGIKARVIHNQYEVASIPFEIFQNADDAVIEMQKLQLADGRQEFDALAIGRFVMQTSDQIIRFAHWGRPINYAGRFTSYNAEFANDLERMLMLGASAKDADEGVTGKFGLGFKSVLLASRTPRVWSGDLCFEVAAGCIPRKWKANKASKQFQQEVQTPNQRSLRETVIELPLDSNIKAVDVSDRFSKLAGLLPVFSQKIRCVVVGDEMHTWQPRYICLASGRRIEFGSVSLPVDGGRVHSGILVFRVNSGIVVLRIGASGIEEFDRKAQPAVPATWVTAPTRGTAARGVLMNARFQIDTGRATLAHGKNASDLNTALVLRVAYEISPILIDLQTKSELNWSVIVAELGCSQSVSMAGFWFGLWEKFLGDPPQPDCAEDMRLIEIFTCEVLRTVVDQTGRIPNGFNGNNAALVKVESLSLSVNQNYLAKALPVLSDWSLFVDKYPVEGWCTDQVFGWLKRSSLAEEESFPSLGLAQVLKAFDYGHLPPAEVANLARVLIAWPSNLSEPYRWQAEMTSLSLRSFAGTWVSAKAVIRGLEPEVQLLIEFAPAQAVLHPDYLINSQEFYTVNQYLPEWDDDPHMIAGWCMNASGDGPQAACAKWLVRNIYEQVIEILRLKRHMVGWLFQLNEDSVALAELTTEEKRLLLSKLGLASSGQEELPEMFMPSLDLTSIYGWWSENNAKWLAEFDSKFWPSNFDPKELTKDEPYDRTAWMTLFSLGLFRRYGRVTDQQHRGFLDFLGSKGWWHTICEVHPDTDAEAWMNILRAYGDGQQTEVLFELWMDSFPRLYRIARSLDTYVHLFQTLDHRDSKLAKFLLTPASDPSLSGSGIEAPTLRYMLRLGQHLVIRELLRQGILTNDVAREMAFTPRSAVLELMTRLGYPNLSNSNQIYSVLVEELGQEAACFCGSYDIPLQLVATNNEARREAEQWAENRISRESDEGSQQRELL